MKNSILFSAVLCFVSISTCCALQDSSKEFDAKFSAVSQIFEKAVSPYLMKFAQASYSQKEIKESPGLAEAQYRIYVQRAQFIAKDLKSALLSSNDTSTQTTEELTEKLQFMYRNNFPGLDYRFFEDVSKQIKSAGIK